MFRFLLAFGFPLLMLGLLEVALRLAGYGYPTGFFLPVAMEGKDRLIENPRFGWRFFPPLLARTPQPVNIPAEKPPGVHRILIFGESAAMGDPEPAYGFPRMLQVLLKARYPDRQFEVVNLAMTAINSHVILPQARESAKRQGDVWVFYLGNNEVVGPFGAGTALGKQSSSLFLVRANLALRSLRIGQFMTGLSHRLQGDSIPRQWEGMEMFLDRRLPAGDSRLETVYRHFSSNLADCLQAGLKSGAHVLLCTMAVNLKDCPPFASSHAHPFTSARSNQWQEVYGQACRDQESGDYSQALQVFQKAAQIDPGYAELHFRWAQCAEQLGDLAEAKGHYQQARDLDALRFRADSRINQIITNSLLLNPKVRLIDVAGQFSQASQNGIPGETLFYEHVHFTPEGNYLLARQVAQSVGESLGWERPEAPPWLSLEECADRLGLTPWHRLQILENLHARLRKPPFTFQYGHTQRLDQLVAAIATLKSTASSNSLETWLATCQAALAREPDDWHLHNQLGKLLEAHGRAEAAVSHWRRVTELAPNYVMGYYQLGRLLNRGKDRSQTIALMNRALQMVPHFPEAHNSLGIAFAHQKQPEQSYDHFARAIQFRPDYAEAFLNWGMTLLSFGQTNGAMARINDAIRVNPGFAEARHKRGLLLVRLGHLAEAQAEFAKAVAAKPAFATARYDFGIALARQLRFKEAAAQFQEVLRLDPNYPAARSMLEKALELDQAK